MKGKIKILVVDDDPAVLTATVRIVQSAGHETLTASSGGETIHMARAHRPDLILQDVMLPDILGTEVCRQIKADSLFDGTLVVLVSSLKTSSDEQSDGLDVGADGYIARPVTNRELKSRVNAWCASCVPSANATV